jgi:hypothetical protein
MAQNITEPLMADGTDAVQQETSQTAIKLGVVITSSEKETTRTNQFAQSKYAWLLALSVAMLLIFTLVYAFATSSVTHPLCFATDATTATRYLRWLSEAVTLSLIALLAASADIVVWAATSSERGITFATWLAMSGTTGIVGLIRLFWWRHQGKGGRDWHHLWIILR